MKDNGDVQFSDLFDPRQPRSNKNLIESRLAICNECPWLDKRMTKCRQCGCFMHLKTTLRSAKCPLDKWWSLIPSENNQEDYLDRIKRRWDSALLSDDQNKNIWDDTWMTYTDTPEEEESEKKFKKLN